MAPRSAALLAAVLTAPLLLTVPAAAAPGDPLGDLTVVSATFSGAVPDPAQPATARYCGGLGQPTCAFVGAITSPDDPTSQVRWGTAVSSPTTWTDQSGLGFAPAAAAPALEDEDVVLGSLVHVNRPVTGSVDQVSLRVVPRLTTPQGGVVELPVPVVLTVDETPNSGTLAGCPYPSTSPCADAITIAGGAATGTVVAGVTRYTAAVLGFEDAAGEPVTRFVSQEGTTNNAARLVGRVTTASALTADAGPDQDVPEGTTVTLAGATGPAGAVRSWTQVSGPAVVLDDPGATSPVFTAPQVAADEVLVFELSAAGEPWAPATDRVEVLVRQVNQAPVADAGPDLVVEQDAPDGALVALDGSGSSDPDGDPLVLTWALPSGTASGPSPQVRLPAGTSVVVLTADDGTTTSTDAVEVLVQDTTAPGITATRTPDAGSGWAASPVTVDFSCTDSGSGVVSCGPDAVLGEGADQSVTGTAVDAAGLRSTLVVDGVSVDLTDPVVAFGGVRPAYQVDEVLAITCRAEDVLSGLATVDCPELSGPAWEHPGTTTLTATARDQAGNASTATATFSVEVTTAGLCRLVTSLSDDAGVARSLCQKLESAQASADRGQADAAEQQRQAFRQELAAQSGKALTAEEAERLSALSREL